MHITGQIESELGLFPHHLGVGDFEDDGKIIRPKRDIRPN